MGVPALALQEIYEAYREQRLVDVLDCLDEEFSFITHAPAEVVPGGDKPRTKAETETLLRYFMDTYDFLTFDPGPIIVTGERATVQPHVRLRHRATGMVLDTKFKHLWHFRGDKIVGLEESYDIPTVEAFVKDVGAE